MPLASDPGKPSMGATKARGELRLLIQPSDITGLIAAEQHQQGVAEPALPTLA